MSVADHAGSSHEAFEIFGGVPQGDPLSPLLYVGYLNVISETLRLATAGKGVVLGDASVQALAYGDMVMT